MVLANVTPITISIQEIALSILLYKDLGISSSPTFRKPISISSLMWFLQSQGKYIEFFGGISMGIFRIYSWISLRSHVSFSLSYVVNKYRHCWVPHWQVQFNVDNLNSWLIKNDSINFTINCVRYISYKYIMVERSNTRVEIY